MLLCCEVGIVLRHLRSWHNKCSVVPLKTPRGSAPSMPNVWAQVGAGGFMVLRPDSGDPVEAVLMALRAAEKVMHEVMNC